MLLLTMRPNIKIYIRQQTEVYCLSLLKVSSDFIVLQLFEKESPKWVLLHNIRIPRGIKEPFVLNDCVKMFFLRHNAGADQITLGFEAPLDVDIMRSNCKSVIAGHFFKGGPSLPVCEYQP